MSTVSYVDNLSITDGSQYVSSGAIHWEDDFNSNLSRWTIGVDASSQPLAVYDGGNGEMDISTKDNFPSIYSQDISATVGETYGVSLEVMASTGTANPNCAGQGSGSLYAELEFYVNSQWVSYSANVFSPLTTAPTVVHLAGVKAPSDKMRIKIRYLAPPCASQYWNTITADLTSIKVTKKIWQSDRYNNYDFGARIYDPRIARWLSPDPLSVDYPYASPYNFALNTPIQAFDPDGSLVIFVNGYRAGSAVLTDLLDPLGLNRFIRRNTTTEGIFTKDYYKYWDVLDDKFMERIGDNNAIWADASSHMFSTASYREARGVEAGEALLKQIDAGKVKIKAGETIKLVSHSQGSAYAAGMAKVLIKAGYTIEVSYNVAPKQPSDFKNAFEVDRTVQYSSEKDMIAPQSKMRGPVERAPFPGDDDGPIDGHLVGNYLKIFEIKKGEEGYVAPRNDVVIPLKP